MIKNQFFILFSVCFFYGCIGGGTHGYIKAYRYPTTKTVLEKAVQKVILHNPFVIQDSLKDYYNDDTNYISIRVIEKGLSFFYTFRYYGDEEYWRDSWTSSIFIAYAHDEKGNGGSAGNGGVKWYEFKKRKMLIEPFESEVVKKIDDLLGLKHIEE